MTENKNQVEFNQDKVSPSRAFSYESKSHRHISDQTQWKWMFERLSIDSLPSILLSALNETISTYKMIHIIHTHMYVNMSKFNESDRAHYARIHMKPNLW